MSIPVEELKNRLKIAMAQARIRPIELSEKTGIPKSSISQYMSGYTKPNGERVYLISKVLGVSEAWLMGFDVPMDRKSNPPTSKFNNLPEPNITENYTTFPVIGEVAAGYECIAVEDWEGELIDIPDQYLSGHNKSDFFVLRVKGDSMYPQYQEGDKVLILKQSTMDYSGQIGVVVYGDDNGTLKKVEYAQGEDWMKLIPINPSFPPKEITNEDLEHCRVLGVPRLLIREVNQSKITKTNSLSTKRSERARTSARFDDNNERIAAFGGIKEDDDSTYTT